MTTATTSEALKPAVTSPLAPGLPLTVDLSWHLARRLAHAATADLVAEIRATGADAWVAQQLDPGSIDDSACDALLADSFPWLGADPVELDRLSSGRSWLGALHVGRATALRQLMSRRVLLESVVELFGDLLYVPFISDKAYKWVLDFDREVIRAHAFGTFRDMLYASVTHPAQLEFLDNTSNTKDSVNENLGRELLELHTVGAVNPLDGSDSYTQDDVRNSSLLLTGHTQKGGLSYEYVAADHYVGPITVMGFSHPNATAAGGPVALHAYTDYLARHPLTARRIATRLCVRFVSDAPPAALVDALAATYLAQDTAITPVLAALVASPEFRAATGLKLRRPAEYTASALRAARTGIRIRNDTVTSTRTALSTLSDRLRTCDHYPRGWPVVNGYPDVAAAWTSTQAMIGRTGAAYDVASQSDPELPSTASWAQTLGLTAGTTALAGARLLVVTLTGFVPTPAHRKAIAQVLAGDGVAVGRPLAQTQIDANCVEAVALVLSSPYFSLR